MKRLTAHPRVSTESILLPTTPRANWVFVGPHGDGKLTPADRDAPIADLLNGPDDVLPLGIIPMTATVHATAQGLKLSDIDPLPAVRIMDLDAGVSYEVVVELGYDGQPHKLTRLSVITANRQDVQSVVQITPAELVRIAVDHVLGKEPPRRQPRRRGASEPVNLATVAAVATRAENEARASRAIGRRPLIEVDGIQRPLSARWAVKVYVGNGLSVEYADKLIDRARRAGFEIPKNRSGRPPTKGTPIESE